MNESKNVRKNVSMMLTGMVIGAALTGGSIAVAAGISAEPTWQPIFVDGQQVEMQAYCQVYADEDYGDQIDDFCIHPDELEENDDIKHWGKVNIDGSYRYYVENGVISPENSDI